MGNKGYVYTIEVMLAVAIIMFMIVLTFSSTPEQPETDVALIKQNGYDALSYLDNAGVLRELVTRINSTPYLRANITSLISSNIAFDVAICPDNCTSYSSPDNEFVVVTDYYIGSYRDRYVGKKVRLWLWELF